MTQNSNIFELDKNYSTTRRVTKQKPVIENKPEDKVKTQLFLPAKPDRKGEGGLRTQGYFKHSEPDKPLISIITVVFNGEKYLEQTIQSVINQTYDNVEYIIIDGGSTDGTLDIIIKYEGMVDYWVSEGDEGISDAFNKGIELCTGEMIGIINADDWYEINSVKIIVSSFLKFGIGIYYGRISFWKNDKPLYTRSANSKKLKYEMSLNHPSVFIHIENYKKIGHFNTSYKLAMDYDLLLRGITNKLNFFYIDDVISNMRYGGVSNTTRTKSIYEEFSIRTKYFNKFISMIIFIKQVFMAYSAKLFCYLGLEQCVYLIKKNLYKNQK